MGQRPGLVKATALRLAEGPVQALGVITKPSGVSALIPDNCTTIGGVSRVSAALTGNTWGIRSASGGMFFDVDNSNGQPVIGTSGTQTADLIAVHPSGKLVVFGYRFVASGNNRLALDFRRTADMVQVATHTLSVGSAPFKVVNHLCFSDNALWAAFDGYDSGNFSYSVGYLTLTPSVADWSGSFTLTVGTWYPQFHPQSNAETNREQSSPAGDGVAVGRHKQGSTEFIYLAARGRKPTANRPDGFATTISTSPSGGYGEVISDRIIYLRSGVWKIQVPASLSGGPAVTWTQFTPTPARTDPGHVELGRSLASLIINHLSFRLSSWLSRRPRGALPTALRVDPRDGAVIVAFTNSGWACAPNGSVTASIHAPTIGIGASTLAKITASGNLAWEVDNESLFGDETGGRIDAVSTAYPTDAPDFNNLGGTLGTTNKDGPAIRAIAVDGVGNVYCAGRVSANGFSVFKRSGNSGALLWQKPVDGVAQAGAAGRGVRPHAIDVDPSDGTVVVVFTRNDQYATVGTPPQAHLMKLNPADGSIVYTADLEPDAVDGRCVACVGGSIYYGTTWAS